MEPNKNEQKDSFYNPYFPNAQAPTQPKVTVSNGGQDIGDTSEPYTTELKDNRNWWQKLNRRHWIIIGSATAVLLVSGGATIALLSRQAPKKAAPAASAPAKEGPKVTVSALTGIPVSAEDRQRPVTAVMIENSPASRPQSGLKEAGVVFEAIAEYGITRFMALYQEAKPANIGPIRSARLYYVNWAQGYDASYAHVGGSPEALNYIKSNPSFKDMDQMGNAGYYQRIGSRPAPHNVYTSMDKLNELQKTVGWFNEPNFTGFTRKKAAPAATPTGNAIDIAISGPGYNVHYDYDKATNKYNRVMGGTPHVDQETNTQLTPDVVVTLVVPYSLQADGYHSNYAVVGAGQAYVFQDGTVTAASWSKASATASLQLKDNDGKDLALNPGQTWITAVGNINSVSSRQ